jgi:hypothetical protein
VSTEHETHVESDPLVKSLAWTWAWCSCGWRGEGRASLTQAINDRKRHEEEVSS